MCDKVEKVLQNGKLSSTKMTLHADEDKELADMLTRWGERGELLSNTVNAVSPFYHDLNENNVTFLVLKNSIFFC